MFCTQTKEYYVKIYVTLLQKEKSLAYNLHYTVLFMQGQDASFIYLGNNNYSMGEIERGEL
jgi:hypothetical protein